MTCDAAYLERNRLVALLARLYPSYVTRTEIEGWEPEWHNCVYIQTPEGQLSWHFHDREMFLFQNMVQSMDGVEWDGHTTEEKYNRIKTLCGKFDHEDRLRRNIMVGPRHRHGKHWWQFWL